MRLCEYALFIHCKYYKVRLPRAPVMGYVRDSFSLKSRTQGVFLHTAAEISAKGCAPLFSCSEGRARANATSGCGHGIVIACDVCIANVLLGTAAVIPLAQTV